ncbi:MAG TPA: hypothetical protein VLT62_19845 [Candidatus Methylomirabilis sp.]|nr:hypothetical protein [Candidatus Methylomirabilis sp.]HSB81548.1 hypothetical protein [Candidatus Methylomirabilis sp.]
MHRTTLAVCVCLLSVATWAGLASAHGFAGKRFFPATLVIEDPFVADELSLPTVSHIKTPGEGDEPATKETEYEFEFSKRITPNFGISFSETVRRLVPKEGKPRLGFGNLEVGGKYQFFKSDRHETILSIGLDTEIGGTGRKALEADSFTTFTPSFFFGKGFGDLPDSVSFLKPLAITGALGVALPTRSKNVTVTDDEVEIERIPQVLQWGFAIEYSIPYLQSFVKDIGLPAPFNRMIPIVELSFETPMSAGQSGRTTGTVNPGILWAGKSFQVGVEAIIPINSRTGKNVGVIGHLHFFLDDLFPKTLGRPLFGE